MCTHQIGAFEVDMLESDLLRYTNTGDDIMTARFLVDFAVASEALYVWVFFNEYFKNKEPKVLQIFKKKFIATKT